MAEEFSFKHKNTNEFIGFQFEKNEDGSVDIHQESYVTQLLRGWGMVHNPVGKLRAEFRLSKESNFLLSRWN
jgi:hypothetical protein